jgi:hypothetical protein
MELRKVVADGGFQARRTVVASFQLGSIVRWLARSIRVRRAGGTFPGVEDPACSSSQLDGLMDRGGTNPSTGGIDMLRR